MTRLPDWPERLVLAIERNRRPFEWGRADCFTFGMDVIEALTGDDPFAEDRGQYDSARGAARRLKARGYRSMEHLLSTIAGRVPVALAQRGDIGLAYEASPMETLPGIVVFAAPRPLARSMTGLMTVDIGRVTKAFRIA